MKQVLVEALASLKEVEGKVVDVGFELLHKGKDDPQCLQWCWWLEEVETYLYRAIRVLKEVVDDMEHEQEEQEEQEE
jgi:hypothetical protein